MKKVFLAMFMFSLLLISCNKDDSPQPAPEPEPEPTVELKSEINDFIWKGLNSEYYWQKDITALADTKDDNKDEYHTYLNGYSDSKELFESLLFDKGNTDRFSWYISDYKKQDAAFRGVTDAFGFEFDISRLSETSEAVIGYITYVVPNSPASQANLKRGDIFYKFNGTTLNINNYRIVNKYYSDRTISLSFATIENEAIVPNDKEANLSVVSLTENPVFYSDIITSANGRKIGYLVYNGFKYTFHEELNNVFGDFKSGGITELVLDLRYNGGGSVLTSAYLASMIHSGATTNDIFGKLVHNNKNTSENSTYPFFNDARIFDKEGNNTNRDVSINRLSSLSKVYVITSRNTASASEMIINGLRPYVDVVQIGTKTYGKNVGSYTVYDSPGFGSENINSNHTVAMQPITFKIFNKLDQSDYTNGFSPNHEVVEYVSEMKPFGDKEEPLLKKALNLIDGVNTKSSSKEPSLKTIYLQSSFDARPLSKEMYLLPDEVK